MKRFSVIVLCYRNFKYIFDAINSVILQNYPNIELIISDDGSEGFPKKVIAEFVENTKKDNIKSVVIRSEPQNCGTVKHLNHTIEIASGDYICFLAADDILYDSTVLMKYVSGFEQSSKEYFVEMAQTAMCDETMQNIDCFYLQPNIQTILESENREQDLFAALAWSPCLPSTSTCFRKAFFERYGKFDESYLLIEDLPMHLKLALKKISIYYNNFCAIRHREGGISHGAKETLSETKREYWREWLEIQESVRNNIKFLDKEDRERVTRKYKKEKIYYDSQIWGRSPKWTDRIRYRVMHPLFVLNNIINLIDSKISNMGIYVVLGAIIGECFSRDGLHLINILFQSIDFNSAVSIVSGLCGVGVILGLIMSGIHIWAIMLKCEKNAPEYCMYLRA